MRNKAEVKHSLVGLLQHARYEVLPTPSTEEKVLAHLPVGHTVTVTASPSKGLDVTFDLAERLGKAGYTAVPHLAARMVSGRAELEEICARLIAADITTIFVPGGDADTVGTYPDALALLEDLKEIGSPFAHVGITGYPESHPEHHRRRHRSSRCGTSVATPRTSSATSPSTPRCSRPGSAGCGHAASPCRCWSGCPAPSTAPSCWGWRRRSASASPPSSWRRTSGCSPASPLRAASPASGSWSSVAPALTPPSALVEGLHVFTFNQIAETEAWRTSMIERLSR